MAKSFKQLAPKAEPQKRTSEKDILDFLEQEKTPTEENKPSDPQTGRNIGNTKKIDVNDNISNTSNTAIAPGAQDNGVTGVIEEDIDVRQTFIIGQQYLNRLKDFVHTKRMSGQYEYTQKQALHDALDRLFEGAVIEERPTHIRQQEETRKQRIRRGITK
jgi:hypothetical protein